MNSNENVENSGEVMEAQTPGSGEEGSVQGISFGGELVHRGIEQESPEDIGTYFKVLQIPGRTKVTKQWRSKQPQTPKCSQKLQCLLPRMNKPNPSPPMAEDILLDPPVNPA